MASCCVDCPFEGTPRLPVDSDVFRPIRNKGHQKQHEITPFHRAYTRLRFIADITLTFHITWGVPVTVHKVPMEAETDIIEYMGSYFEPWKRCGVTIKAQKKVIKSMSGLKSWFLSTFSTVCFFLVGCKAVDLVVELHLRGSPNQPILWFWFQKIMNMQNLLLVSENHEYAKLTLGFRKSWICKIDFWF